MDIILIFGPQAVGKMTIGKKLAEKTGYKLLHNHVSLEVAAQFFPFGSEPFKKLDTTIRYKIFELLKEEEHKAMIFTYTWPLDSEKDWEYIEDILEKYSEKTYFVELRASLETRLERNTMIDRIEAKPTKKDKDLSRRLVLGYEDKYQWYSNNDFPYKEHLIIDTEIHSVDEAAELIIDRFRIAS